MSVILTNHQKGYRRDNGILEAIERLGALSTEQICLLFFQGIKNDMRMAQKRLQRLYDAKKVKRVRESIDKPYYYYTGKRPGQIEHLIYLNWMYLWLKSSVKGWGEIHCFNREQDYKILRADAFAGIKDTKGDFYFSFIEMDIAESGNEFRKVELYNKLYESEKYSSWWWVDLASGFPPIYIITTGPRDKILQKVESENIHGLEFRVRSLDEIKEGCR